jgi:hypothetical protein
MIQPVAILQQHVGSEEQIVAILKRGEAKLITTKLCRKCFCHSLARGLLARRKEVLWTVAVALRPMVTAPQISDTVPPRSVDY